MWVNRLSVYVCVFVCVEGVYVTCVLVIFICLKEKKKNNTGTSLVAETVKRLPTMRETRFNSCIRKMPWRRKWHPTPVLLPGKSHGQRILVGYSHGVAKSQTQLSDFTLLHRKNKKECSYMIKNHVYCKDPYAGVKRLALHSLFY